MKLQCWEIVRLSRCRQTEGSSSHQVTNWDLSQVKINRCAFSACWIGFDPAQLWGQAQDTVAARGKVSGGSEPRQWWPGGGPWGRRADGGWARAPPLCRAA